MDIPVQSSYFMYPGYLPSKPFPTTISHLSGNQEKDFLIGRQRNIERNPFGVRSFVAP